MPTLQTKMLVVDDDPSTRQPMSQIFSGLGHTRCDPPKMALRRCRRYGKSARSSAV